LILHESSEATEALKSFATNANLSPQAVQAHVDAATATSLVKENTLLLSLSLYDANDTRSGTLLSALTHEEIGNLRTRMLQDTLLLATLLILIMVLFALYQKQRYLSHALTHQDEELEETVQERTGELLRHNSFMRSLFQTIPLPAFLKDREGTFVKCNKAYADLVSLSPKEMTGMKPEALFEKSVVEEATKADAYVLKIQRPFAYEQQIIINGKTRHFVIHKNVLKEGEETIGIVAIMQEITDRKNYQLKLEKTLEENHKQKAKLAHDHEIINQYAIYVRLDAVGIITEASEAMASVSGFSKAELVGKGWYNFCQENKVLIEELRTRIKTKKRWEGTLAFERKDGNTYWLKSSLLAQHDEEGNPTGYLVFGKDVSNEVRIKGLTYIDELTQIYNRKKLNETLKNALSVAHRYPHEQTTFILFDIDDFKGVNDTHGHLVGDSILQELSKLVESNLRDVDTLARWGGEEFAIVAPKTSLEGALKITEKLRQLIASHHFQKVEHITCSFGITEIKPEDTQDSLVQRADEALYSSKSKGKNRIEFLG
jgi:diguanylate cyclase (GGDEF)-like protein/PAS domain S-box-containing protein